MKSVIAVETWNVMTYNTEIKIQWYANHMLNRDPPGCDENLTLSSRTHTNQTPCPFHRKSYSTYVTFKLDSCTRRAKEDRR